MLCFRQVVNRIKNFIKLLLRVILISFTFNFLRAMSNEAYQLNLKEQNASFYSYIFHVVYKNGSFRLQIYLVDFSLPKKKEEKKISKETWKF